MEEVNGIILKRIDYKESSKIVYVYTPEGMTSFLVHGANKMNSPFSAITETLTKVTLFGQGKNLKVLRDATLLKRYSQIKGDLEKYNYVLHLFELIYHFQEDQMDHMKLYPFLEKILNKIEENEEYIPYIYMFESKLLYLLGVSPRFQECIQCQKKEPLYFSVKDGGMLCDLHTHNPVKYLDETVQTLKYLYYFDLQKHALETIPVEIIKEIRFLLDEYYLYHLNMTTKSRTVLKSLIGY